MTDIFTIQDFHFPEGFLWGSATAAHQIEGNNIHSNNWAEEQKWLAQDPLLKFQAPPVIIIRCTKRIYSFCLILTTAPIAWESSGRAIEPEEGVFLPDELEHYVKELSMLQGKGHSNLCHAHSHIPAPVVC